MPSGHGKARSSTNAPDNTGLNVNEKILKECHELYVDKSSPERGIVVLYFSLTVDQVSFLGNGL